MRMVEQEIELEVIEQQASEIAEYSPFSPEQARVIACRREGLSHAESAAVLEKPAGTVRSTWRACRRKWAEVVWAEHHLSSPDFNFESDDEARRYVLE